MATKRTEATLRYPEHQFTPADFVHFVHLDEFADDWERLGLDLEDDLSALEFLIMANPKGAPVVPGTGGLRKLRFAPERWKVGRSGAARVGYAYFEAHWHVLLMVAYGKGEKDDLTPEERKAIKEYLARTEKYLENRNY